MIMTETRNNAVAKSEAAGVEGIRRQYQEEGYRVLERLPVSNDDPLSAYRPDLIVQKGDEIVVVEMKRPVELRDAADLRTLRGEIERHPGWHFRLLYLDNFDQKPALNKDVRNKIVADYRQRAGRAREALRKGHLEDATVLLWIALEGALRAYFSRHGEAPNKGVTVLSMLRRLYEEGILDDSEMKLLTGGYDARNLAVHALKFTLSKMTIQRIFNTVDALVDHLFATANHSRKVGTR
jgi:REase_AHJR-like